MTVLRREDVQSKVASWDERPSRIVSSLILTIVPLIIRRLRGPSPNRITRASRGYLCPYHYRSRLERRPQETGQLARNRHGNLRCGLVLFRQTPEPATQSLLRLVCDRDHAGRLSFASSREANAEIRSVLIVPRRFHEQPADQGGAGPRDAVPPMLLATGVFAWHQPEIRHDCARRVEPAKLMQLGQDQDRRQPSPSRTRRSRAYPAPTI